MFLVRQSFLRYFFLCNAKNFVALLFNQKPKEKKIGPLNNRIESVAMLSFDRQYNCCWFKFQFHF